VRGTLLALLLAACGDNNIPHPDAARTPDAPGPVLEIPVDAAPDAGTPDAPPPVCDDSHIEINGHEHKCQHEGK
jgi:hypothetical protein